MKILYALLLTFGLLAGVSNDCVAVGGDDLIVVPKGSPVLAYSILGLQAGFFANFLSANTLTQKAVANAVGIVFAGLTGYAQRQETKPGLLKGLFLKFVMNKPVDGYYMALTGIGYILGGVIGYGARELCGTIYEGVRGYLKGNAPVKPGDEGDNSAGDAEKNITRGALSQTPNTTENTQENKE